MGKSDENQVEYTCPMHPEILQPHPFSQVEPEHDAVAAHVGRVHVCQRDVSGHVDGAGNEGETDGDAGSFFFGDNL